MGIFHFDWRGKVNGNVIQTTYMWIAIDKFVACKNQEEALIADWVAMFDALSACLRMHNSIFTRSVLKSLDHKIKTTNFEPNPTCHMRGHGASILFDYGRAVTYRAQTSV